MSSRLRKVGNEASDYVNQSHKDLHHSVAEAFDDGEGLVEAAGQQDLFRSAAKRGGVRHDVVGRPM